MSEKKGYKITYFPYICECCGRETIKKARVRFGLRVLCPDCRNVIDGGKHSTKFLTYENLDQGKVMALYKAKRSVHWIAEDMHTTDDVIERILKENNYGNSI